MAADDFATACARGRTAFPDVQLDDAVFTARLRELLAAEPARTLESFAIEDLWLATACLHRDRQALAILDARFFHDAIAALRGVDASPAFADEALQQLRAKMLVGDGDGDARGRLTAYSGEGSLAGWLRISALRLGLSLQRKVWREVPLEDAFAGESDPARSPEEQLARRQHAALIARALREVIAEQPSRTRAVLRYYYGDRVGVEDIGRIYNVHASTVSRWLASARDAILEGTRRRVAAALGVAPNDADALFGLTPSLDVSLHGLLATAST